MKTHSLVTSAFTVTATVALSAALALPSSASPVLSTGATSSHGAGSHSHDDGATQKPTVVLVHGAWADSAGWDAVIKRLQRDGYEVLAPPNPLRGLTSDAAYISSYLDRIPGPVVLVGHSYGGAVITNAARGHTNIKALVYIAAFAPDEGDSLQSLNGSELGTRIPALPLQPAPYPKPDGEVGTEVTIEYSQYSNVFLDDELAQEQADALAVEQRPLSLDSVVETSGAPAWKSIPSWYLIATDDRAISPDLERFMAQRAGAYTVEVDSPHLAMVTDPEPVTDLIRDAATATDTR